MAKALKKPRKNAAASYKMAEPLPQGEILTDIVKNKWKLGPYVGKGGFGEIYSAQNLSGKSSKKYPYVIKVEPHENGPLFVEMHFYMKNAKPADIEAFKQKHKLKTFGMPVYLGSGSHEINSNKYRFIVMEKFGTDLDKVWQENGGSLPLPVIFQLAWQMTYVLQYMHECGYVHADLKGGNILMGITPENQHQAYLIDFGLATKFSNLKEYKPNPKKAHDGTIEYLSRDAHHGVPTRRGDLEILGYNIIRWLGGKLPWESRLNDVKAVHESKEQAMKDIPKFVNACFDSMKINCTDTVITFLKYVNDLKFNEKPDYQKILELFKAEVEKNGAKVDGPLEFQKSRKRRPVGEELQTSETDTKNGEMPSRKNGRVGRKKVVKEENSDKGPTPKKIVRRQKKEEENIVQENGEVNSEKGAKSKKVGRRRKKVNEENGEIPTAPIEENSGKALTFKNVIRRQRVEEHNIEENGEEIQLTAAVEENSENRATSKNVRRKKRVEESNVDENSKENSEKGPTSTKVIRRHRKVEKNSDIENGGETMTAAMEEVMEKLKDRKATTTRRLKNK